MIELIKKGVYLLKGRVVAENADKMSLDDINNRLTEAGCGRLEAAEITREAAAKNTIAYRILTAHNTSNDRNNFKIRFDALASHDITYVGIVQTARASGLKEFPVPYVLTNCHNSLCAVGGTINEDDHIFGLSASRKYGGIYVPAHQAVIHQYMREMLAGCGKMILGSDSHTRYGPLGTLAIGEGGGEIVKQLLGKSYDLSRPEVVAVYLTGRLKKGVGPHDVALALIGAVFKDGFAKNKVLEFVGPGVDNLSIDFRNGIDVMTTETACLSSIWRTDAATERFYEIHGRKGDYRQLEPGEASYYDGMVKIDLNNIEPMIALPFHPSNVWTIRELNQNALEILREAEEAGQKQMENSRVKFRLSDKIKNGRLQTDQGVVAGCAGGSFENIAAMSQILAGNSVGQDAFALSVYPSSQPVKLALLANKSLENLIIAGAVIRTAFCGPCFGAGDVPANNGLSIRHTTRNFHNREGSKPSENQIASVALMDARSIAATALHGGMLTAATEIEYDDKKFEYSFNQKIYENRVYQGFGKANPEEELILGPNIRDWPSMPALSENLLLKVISVIHDPVTTTDELIPSGETSSFRSDPLRLAEFTLSRKDPQYVGRAKAVRTLEQEKNGTQPQEELAAIWRTLSGEKVVSCRIDEWLQDTIIGSTIFAVKPGDGSAREQAASCQRVLGGAANIAVEYATKRYRSNLINWGIIPFVIEPGDKSKLNVDDYLYLPEIRQVLQNGDESIQATVIGKQGQTTIRLKLESLSANEREVILAGCLINYYNY